MNQPKKGFFRRLMDRLAKTRRGLVDKMREVLTGRTRVDDDLLEDLEAVLLGADVGVKTTGFILGRLKEEASKSGLKGSEAILEMVKRMVLEAVGDDEFELAVDEGPKPFVILVVGVNGTGKSTTIGKLAKQYTESGLKVLLVAADTFRAAAADQLEIWSKRSGSGIVRREEGADPAAVAFDGVKEAKAGGYDVVLIDTAGRLHTKKHLMAELDKITRVVKKVLPDAPHETVLVLDATTGQNAIQQCREFNEITKISAIIMTKLDGTAKGGILVAIRHLFDVPIVKIGIGEGPDDLRDFIPGDFVRALFGEEPEEGDEDGEEADEEVAG